MLYYCIIITTTTTTTTVYYRKLFRKIMYLKSNTKLSKKKSSRNYIN